jgi:hypothetical protein
MRCVNYRFTAQGRDLLATVVTVPELARRTFIELETVADPGDVDVVRSTLRELGIEEQQDSACRSGPCPLAPWHASLRYRVAGAGKREEGEEKLLWVASTTSKTMMTSTGGTGTILTGRFRVKIPVANTKGRTTTRSDHYGASGASRVG